MRPEMKKLTVALSVIASLALACWIYVRTHPLVFDKLPNPGDHCHGPRRIWAPLRREVVLVDGRMQVIVENNWPAFASNQVELLVKAGFSRATAEAYYWQEAYPALKPVKQK
jgi:hypothetical protein